MKNRIIFICLYLMAICCSTRAQTLLSYGTATVSKDEFLKAFLKNNTDRKPSEKEFRDYLELYIRFKLKVKAAYDMNLQALPGQKAELTDFRNQIIEAYVGDDNSFNHLVKEAFDRSQKDIHLAHIYVALNIGGARNETDTLRAWKMSMDAYNELKRGSDFGNVAGIYSTDSSVKINKGDIGYVTVFTLPYGLETLAYSTPVGMFSLPYRSKAGYHIFKNLGERKAVGRMKAAQILFAFPANADNAVKDLIKQRADSVYTALLKGASFAKMVQMYSNDNETYRSEGEMPAFGVGKFDPAFENAVFALNAGGAISKPILTAIGYHIVKRIEDFPVNADPNNDSALAVMKQLVRNDVRMEVSRKAMFKKILQVTGFKSSIVNEKNLWAYADSSFQGKTLPKLAGITEKTVLFSFPAKNVSVGDWLKSLQSLRDFTVSTRHVTFRDRLVQYEEAVAMEYYRDHLEEYNREFAAQVKEFKEGNLLFEIMQQNIWNKAAGDSLGLMKYFEANKGKYWWEPGAEAIIFTCTDSVTCNDLNAKVQKSGKDWKNIILPFESKVQVDSGRFELGQLPVEEKGELVEGKVTKPTKISADKSNTSFAYIVKTYPGRSPRNFVDAKGLVLNDYQIDMEEKWVASLKNRYPVKVNEVVLRSLWNTN